MSGPVPPGAPARHLLADHQDLADRAASVLDHVDRLTVQVAALVEHDREQRVRAELAAIDVERLAAVTDRNLRLRALQDAGYRTVADLLDVDAETLDQVPGVGTQTARGVVAAVDQLTEATRAGTPLRIEVDHSGAPDTSATAALVRALHRLLRLGPLVEPHRQALTDCTSTAAALLRTAAPTRYRVRLALSRPPARRAALDALTAVDRQHAHLTAHQFPTLVDRLALACQEPDPDPLGLWSDFEQQAAHYYTLLGRIVPGALDVLAARGMLTADLADRVAAHPLDLSAMRTPLRGYQEFGARFALNQGRALIGDEMGLGKTLQALAVIADRATAGQPRSLVVCPAALLVNWLRETTRHTHLPVHRLHGPDRAEGLARWLAEGGVAVTTYDQLAHVPEPAADDLAVLVVDEAHYVKNPRAARSRLMARWTARTLRVLFLTGTPMDNDLDDFLALVRLLQPALADALPRHLRLVGADTFRREVAPVYLRRNQRDVLVELPDLVLVDEWEELPPTAERVYRQAVAAGQLMTMRRAAYVAGPDDSTKLDRLVQIVDEAGANGRRTVVFSFFRDVLDTVATALRTRTVSVVHGPLTGDVPADRRQEVIDEFSAGPGGGVLIAQITVGGVGLNLQAASVAVLCEPQLTPAAEAQAVARLHRMGQTRTVVAHRLLAPDSVDERIVEILAGKARVFDEYVRDSALAEHAVQAVDVSQADLAREVLEAEQARLGYGPVWDELG